MVHVSKGVSSGHNHDLLIDLTCKTTVVALCCHVCPAHFVVQIHRGICTDLVLYFKLVIPIRYENKYS